MGDVVADACTDLAVYLARLEELVPERAEDGIVVAGTRAHMAVSPEPGNGPALRALMTGHEGIRRLLASGRVATAGHPGIRFGGSDACTAKVLELIPKAFAGLDDERRDAAVWFLTKWINGAKTVHGIDEAKKWRHLNRPRPGERYPPRCPYCRCFQLLAEVEAKVVACSVPDCWDGLGLHPVASMNTDEHGRPQLEWADGLIEPGLLEVAGLTASCRTIRPPGICCCTSTGRRSACPPQGPRPHCGRSAAGRSPIRGMCWHWRSQAQPPR